MCAFGSIQRIQRRSEIMRFRRLRRVKRGVFAENAELTVVTLNSKSATEIDNKLPDNLNGPVLPYRMISFEII